jgi:hypothetical protein
MRIEEAIKSIESLPDAWMRHEEVRRVSKGLDLLFGVYGGQRGRQLEAFRISCIGVHEAKITAMDGGGIAIYPSTHPAARGAVARQSEIRWSGADDDAVLMGALYRAHTDAVDDWIPFDRYSTIKKISDDRFSLRGPDFLMRAYAKALRATGEKPRVILGRGNRKTARPKVLHFGDSYVVADAFVAERYTEKEEGL